MTIPKFWSKPIPRLFSDTKFFRNRNRYFFPETKFSETETETFFRDQIFSKPKPRLFFRNQIFRNRNPQRFGKSFETEKFRNRNVNLCLEGSYAKSKAHSGQYFDLFWPSLTPPANPVKFFWSKMACTGVPHIVLHVSCWTRTSWGYFRPSEVRFRGILGQNTPIPL